MPVYEYRCASGHHYEKTEGFDAPREQPCTVCGTMARRQISLPAVIFKGPGFYSTDNRSERRNGHSSESKASTGSSESGGSSAESSGASKVESAAE